MKVRVVAYKDRLVIVPENPTEGITTEHDKMWWPTGGPQGHLLGCVLGNTKEQLGVSEEAFELMKQVRRNRDAVGDISWWEGNDGLYFFSWWGPIHRIINVDTAEGDRDFKVTPSFRKACTIIPNEVPDAAKALLDREEDPVSWGTPVSIIFSETGEFIREENP